jgi:hypothetical protein
LIKIKWHLRKRSENRRKKPKEGGNPFGMIRLSGTGGGDDRPVDFLIILQLAVEASNI